MGALEDTLAEAITPKPQQAGVLMVHLLDRCNLRCLHCYMDAAPERPRLLEAGLVVRTLRETEPLGIRTVYLTGGEPFLHPGLADILASVVPGQNYQLAVCTNGTLIGPAEAALLKAAGASAQVSIDGQAPYHDRFRGAQGAFAAATRGIEALVSAGVPVAAVLTVCQDNLACLPWMAEWALAMGVERVSVQPLQEIGRGAALGSRRLTSEQMCDLYMVLSDFGYRYRARGLRFSLHYRARSYLLAHPCAAYVCNGARCHRQVAKEIKTLVVREDGTVLPEIPTLDPRFALGNIHDAPLPALVPRYFANGYHHFHRLCRTVFMEVMPSFQSPIVPWDEFLSARSWTFDPKSAPDAGFEALHPGKSCGTPPAAPRAAPAPGFPIPQTGPAPPLRAEL